LVTSESPGTQELLAMLAGSTVLARELLPGRINVTSQAGERTSTLRSVASPIPIRISTHLEGFVWEFEDLVQSISYLGPLRSYPARHYLLSRGGRQSVGVRG